MREGDPTQGTTDGSTYTNALRLPSTFGTYALNAAGQVAFGAEAGPPPHGPYAFGIWTGAPGDLMPVARSGDQAPGTPIGTVFSAIPFSIGASPFSGPVISPSGQVAFAALDSSQTSAMIGSGIWMGSSQGLSLVAQAGDHAPGTPNGVNFAAAPATQTQPLPLAFARPEISADGQVAFAGFLAGGA